MPSADNATESSTFLSRDLGRRDSFFADFQGSGSVDALVFDVAFVPVPASLPLLLGALGGIGYMSRRSKANKT